MMNKNKLIFLAFGVSSSMIFSSCNNTTLSNTAKDASANESNEELELPGDSIYYDKEQYKNNDNNLPNNNDLIVEEDSLNNEITDSSWRYSNNTTPEEKILYSLNEKYDLNLSSEDITIDCVSRADNENVFEASVYVKEFDDIFLAVWFDSRKQICDDYPKLCYCEKFNEDKCLILNDEITPDCVNEVIIHYGKTFDSFVGYDDGFDDYISKSDTFYKIKINTDDAYLTEDNSNDIYEFVKYIESLGYKYYLMVNLNDNLNTYESDKAQIDISEFLNNLILK